MLEDLLQELANKVSQKRYLSDRITPDDVQTLVSTLIEVGESIPNKAIQQMNNSPLLLPLVCQPLNPEKRLPYQSQNEKLGIYIREH